LQFETQRVLSAINSMQNLNYCQLKMLGILP